MDLCLIFPSNERQHTMSFSLHSDSKQWDDPEEVDQDQHFHHEDSMNRKNISHILQWLFCEAKNKLLFFLLVRHFDHWSTDWNVLVPFNDVRQTNDGKTIRIEYREKNGAIYEVFFFRRNLSSSKHDDEIVSKLEIEIFINCPLKKSDGELSMKWKGPLIVI